MCRSLTTIYFSILYYHCVLCSCGQSRYILSSTKRKPESSAYLFGMLQRLHINNIIITIHPAFRIRFVAFENINTYYYYIRYDNWTMMASKASAKHIAGDRDLTFPTVKNTKFSNYTEHFIFQRSYICVLWS